MNNELKSLKLRAGVEFNPDQEGLDLFAELIIKECLEICEAGTATQTTSSGAANLIKQKFNIDN